MLHAGRTSLHKGYRPDVDLDYKAAGPLRQIKQDDTFSGHLDPLGNIYYCIMPHFEAYDDAGNVRATVCSAPHRRPLPCGHGDFPGGQLQCL
jgi:hypothetical protein